jgi:chromosome segregation ATPase
MTDAPLQRIEDMLVTQVQSSARHDKWLESIDGRLDSVDSRFKTLNGSVAALTKESIASQIFQAQHAKTIDRLDEIDGRVDEKLNALGAELKSKTNAIDGHITTLQSQFNNEQQISVTTERVNAKYRNALRPWIDKVTIVIIALVLWNGRSILEAFAEALKIRK